MQNQEPVQVAQTREQEQARGQEQVAQSQVVSMGRRDTEVTPEIKFGKAIQKFDDALRAYLHSSTGGRSSDKINGIAKNFWESRLIKQEPQKLFDFGRGLMPSQRQRESTGEDIYRLPGLTFNQKSEKSSIVLNESTPQRVSSNCFY